MLILLASKLTGGRMQERIEQYIRGELTSEEEDELWVEFLVEPQWYKYFDTWLHILTIEWEREV